MHDAHCGRRCYMLQDWIGLPTDLVFSWLCAEIPGLKALVRLADILFALDLELLSTVIRRDGREIRLWNGRLFACDQGLLFDPCVSPPGSALLYGIACKTSVPPDERIGDVTKSS